MLALWILSLGATINSSKQMKTVLLTFRLVYLLFIWSGYNSPHHPLFPQTGSSVTTRKPAENTRLKLQPGYLLNAGKQRANIYHGCFNHRYVLVREGRLSLQKIKLADVYTSAVWTMVHCSSFLKTALQRLLSKGQGCSWTLICTERPPTRVKNNMIQISMAPR